MRSLFLFLVIGTTVLGWAGAAGADDEYAPSSLTPGQLLAKVRAARGSLAEGSYHLVTQVAGGGVTTTEDLRLHGEDSFEVDTSGVFVTAGGSYHGKNWRQDENGLVFLESGFRGEVDPYVRALRYPDDPKSNVHVLGITKTVPAKIVLDVNPAGGEHERLSYDASSYLLLSTERWGADLHRHVSTYSDYRTVFGWRRPFSTTYSDGRPENDTRTTTSTFEKIPFSERDFAIPTSRPIFNLLAFGPVSLPVKFTSDGRIVVRVTIKGRGLDFMLDSGSSSLYIDSGVAQQLGLAPYGKTSTTIGGDVQLSRTKIDDAAIGGLHIQSAEFDVGPMDESFPDGRFVGLLGADFLASGVFEIDYKKEAVTYIPRDLFTKISAGAQPTELKLDDQIPVVEASVDGAKGNFLLDTGAFASIVYPNFFQRTGTRGSISGGYGDVAATGVGGTFHNHVMSMSNLLIGGARFATFQALVPVESTFNIRDYDGILGRDILRAFTIYFDYANNAAFLVPAN